jgi:hypothetical protein
MRTFTKVRCPPFNYVNRNDLVFLKEYSGPVKGVCVIDYVLFFDNLTPSGIIAIAKKYNDLLRLPDYYINSKLNAKYVTLIKMKNIIKTPFIYLKKRSRAGWVVLLPPSEKISSLEEALWYIREYYSKNLR